MVFGVICHDDNLGLSKLRIAKVKQLSMELPYSRHTVSLHLPAFGGLQCVFLLQHPSLV